MNQLSYIVCLADNGKYTILHPFLKHQIHTPSHQEDI